MAKPKKSTQTETELDQIEATTRKAFENIKATLSEMDALNEESSQRRAQMRISISDKSTVNQNELAVLREKIFNLEQQIQSNEVMAHAAFDKTEAMCRSTDNSVMKAITTVLSGAATAGLCGLLVLVIRPAHVDKGVELGFIIGGSFAGLAQLYKDED